MCSLFVYGLASDNLPDWSEATPSASFSTCRTFSDDGFGGETGPLGLWEVESTRGLGCSMSASVFESRAGGEVTPAMSVGDCFRVIFTGS
jgi:hypothetical protein